MQHYIAPEAAIHFSPTISLTPFTMSDFKEEKFIQVDPEFAFSIGPVESSSLKEEKHNAIREELTVFLGEFVGTLMFLAMAFAGTQIANESPVKMSPLPDPSKLIYISFVFAVALAANVAVFSDISGAMFNPAVCSSSLTYPNFS
jgi:glycerol uptake facilitator-like aquaporin